MLHKTVAIEREQRLAELGAAFQRLPPGTRARCPYPLAGNSLTDVWVVVETNDIQQQTIEGVVVALARRTEAPDAHALRT